MNMRDRGINVKGDDVTTMGRKWLSQFQDCLLAEIPFFPAAHNAATGPAPSACVAAEKSASLWERCKDSVLAPWCRTQTLNVSQLLDCGVRLLDVRAIPIMPAVCVAGDGGEQVGRTRFPVAHGPWLSTTTTLESTFADIARFLEANPSEFVILLLREENFSSSEDVAIPILDERGEQLQGQAGKMRSSSAARPPRRHFDRAFPQLLELMRASGVNWYDNQDTKTAGEGGAKSVFDPVHTRVRELRGRCVWIGMDEDVARPHTHADQSLPRQYNFRESGLDDLCPIWCCASVTEAKSLLDLHMWQVAGDQDREATAAGRGGGDALDVDLELGADVGVVDADVPEPPPVIEGVSAHQQSGRIAGTGWTGVALDGWFYWPLRHTNPQLNGWFLTKYVARKKSVGVLMMDFVTPTLCATLVAANRTWLQDGCCSVFKDGDGVVASGSSTTCLSSAVSPATPTQKSVFRVGPSHGRNEKVISLQRRMHGIPFLRQFFRMDGANPARPATHKLSELVGRQFRVKPYCSRHPRETFALQYVGGNGQLFKIWRTDKPNHGWGNDLWLEIEAFLACARRTENGKVLPPCLRPKRHARNVEDESSKRPFFERVVPQGTPADSTGGDMTVPVSAVPVAKSSPESSQELRGSANFATASMRLRRSLSGAVGRAMTSNPQRKSRAGRKILGAGWFADDDADHGHTSDDASSSSNPKANKSRNAAGGLDGHRSKNEDPRSNSGVRAQQDAEQIVVKPKPVELSREEKKLLTKSLQRHFLFSGLEEEEQLSLVLKMRRFSKSSGELVFRQGDTGDCLYILGSGQCTVEIDGKAVKALSRGAIFGELALLYNVDRTASVRVDGETATLWKLDGSTVATTLKQLKQRSQASILRFLDSDPNFGSLSPEEKEGLSGCCTIQEYNAGDTILREGDTSEWMFIVMSGKVMTRDLYGNYNSARKHDFLGSLYNKQQITSAKAPEKVKLLSFGRRNIERLYGFGVETVLKQAVLKGALTKTAFFTELLPEQQQSLMHTFQEETVPPGGMVLSAGSPPQLVVVIDGSLTINNRADAPVGGEHLPDHERCPSPKHTDSTKATSGGDASGACLIPPGAAEDASPSGASSSRNSSPRSAPSPKNLDVGAPHHDADVEMKPRNRSKSPSSSNSNSISNHGKKKGSRSVKSRVAGSDYRAAGSPATSSSRDFSAGKCELRSGDSYGAEEVRTGLLMARDVGAPADHGGAGVTRIYRTSLERILRALLDDAIIADSDKVTTIGALIKQNEVRKVLKEIFLFKSMPEAQLKKVVSALTRKKYRPGEYVFRQKDVSDAFYLIKSGTIEVHVKQVENTLLQDHEGSAGAADGACVGGTAKKGADGGGSGKKVLRTLGVWDYLGERGLLLNESRSASCQALSEGAECFALDKETFLGIVGNFRKVLEHRMRLQDSDITLKDLIPLHVVGKGTFGVVKLCAHRRDPEKQYALKCIDKQAAIRLKQQKSLVIEKEINGQCFHPCIVQFIKTLQDRNTIYFLTEFLGGGDLFLGIRAIGMLTKPQSQFYSASILLALEYLHERRIIYRDLKPENVLLDFEGRAKLVDFGCCKTALRAYTVVGTPEYLAPEVILGKGYTHLVDFWSLGVVMYEFICGPLPFGSDDGEGGQMELFRQILESAVKFPDYVEEDAVSVLSALLEKIPDLRLGSAATREGEIKGHLYFAGFDFNACAGGYMEPVWKPDVEGQKAGWTSCDIADKDDESGMSDVSDVSKDDTKQPNKNDDSNMFAWCAGF